MSLSMIRQQVRNGVRRASKYVADMSGANGPVVISASRVLVRSVRKKIAKKAAIVRKTFGGEEQRVERSAPGEAPRRVSGRLYRSVTTEVVGGIRRIGPGRFTGRLLEEGVDTSTRTFEKRRRKKGLARRTLRIERRPFMEDAYADAQPKMEGEAVSALRARDRTLATF